MLNHAIYTDKWPRSRANNNSKSIPELHFQFWNGMFSNWPILLRLQQKIRFQERRICRYQTRRMSVPDKLVHLEDRHMLPHSGQDWSIYNIYSIIYSRKAMLFSDCIKWSLTLHVNSAIRAQPSYPQWCAHLRLMLLYHISRNQFAQTDQGWDRPQRYIDRSHLRLEDIRI